MVFMATCFSHADVKISQVGACKKAKVVEQFTVFIAGRKEENLIAKNRVRSAMALGISDAGPEPYENLALLCCIEKLGPPEIIQAALIWQWRCVR
jgi:hypothetical protein